MSSAGGPMTHIGWFNLVHKKPNTSSKHFKFWTKEKNELLKTNTNKKIKLAFKEG